MPREVAATEADGTTALHWAVRQNDVELVERMLRAGADVNAANRYGVTPLQLAAVNGDAKLLERLLDAGGDANAAGTDGETLLMTVARGGHVEAARLLIERGAEVDAREAWHGQTALMWAAAQGHPAMLRELIAHGADVNARSNHEQWERQVTSEPRDKWLPPGGLTPLLFAARENCLACLPVLVEAGADVNATTPDGISAVVIALINGHFDVAGALLEAGTDPNLADYTGRTALYAAIDFNTMVKSNRPAPKVLENRLTGLDVARLLLEHGADVNARLKRLPPYRAKLDRGNDGMLGGGTTPFLRAAKAGDLPAMKLLLEHGADPTLAPDPQRHHPADGRRRARHDRGGHDGPAEDARTGHRGDSAAARPRPRHQRPGQRRPNGRARRRHARLSTTSSDSSRRKGAKLDTPDKDGFTPLDVALGKAGGFGFSGKEGVVREGTAAVLRELMARRAAGRRAAR